MRRISVLVAVVVSLAVLTGCAGTMKCGTPMSDAPAAMSAEKVHAKSADLAGKPVRVKGVISGVCTGEPWFEVAGKADETDMDRLVLVACACANGKCMLPATAKGKHAVVEGTLSMYDMPADAAKHYLEQKGASKDQMAKYAGGMKVAKVAATYMEIKGLSAKDCACSGCKCGGDPKKCSNPKCRETGKCQMACCADGKGDGKCCGSEACKKAGKCVMTQDVQTPTKSVHTSEK